MVRLDSLTTTHTRLRELGITLPAPPEAVASYVPARLVDIGDGRSLLYIAGQVSRDGDSVLTGRCPDEVSVEEGARRARLCGLSVLAHIEHAVGLENVIEIAQVIGFVRSADDFGGQPQVMNGASDLFKEVFGDPGQHTRAALGTNALPLGATVEVAAVVVVRTG